MVLKKIPLLPKQSKPEKQYLRLSSMVSEEKWRKICLYLTKKNCSEQKRKNSFEASWIEYCDEKRTILHHACRLKAPILVIEQLTRTYPETVFISDQHGKLPLHVAVEHFAPSDVVEHLIAQYPSAASKKDKEGNTPLHLACEKKVWPRETHEKRKILTILGGLCDAAPDSTVVDNNGGMSAIECAIVNGADLNSVRLLQGTAISLYSARSA